MTVAGQVFRRFAALACTLLCVLAGCKFEMPLMARSERIVAIEATKPDRRTLGMARLAFDEFGALNNHTITTNAMPYKVVVTAMVMERAAREGSSIGPIVPDALFRRYGWITPTSIDNWPGESPRFDKPLGMVSGEFRNVLPRVRLEVSNIGCATCHAGMTYDAQGDPTGRAWLGTANTSRNFDSYLNDILAALRFVKDRPDEFLATIPRVFPDIHPDEMRTITRVVFPEIRKRLADAQGTGETLLPFSNGGPGLTNGVAALKLQLAPNGNLLDSSEHGYVSIPDLHGRLLRSSYLADGVYAADANRRFVSRDESDLAGASRARSASIVAFFLIPTAGIQPTKSERQAKRVEDVLEFVADYRPPRFPGSIDRERALRGAKTFAARCEGCHGRYVEDAHGVRLAAFPNRMVLQDQMGTDPARWQAVSDAGLRAIGRLPVAKKINAARSGGYVAPILSGVWITAPYLHNGSVPTLWHLMRPETRPAKFMVGGHKLDYARVGIAGEMAADGVMRYPTGYVPWSDPGIHDTFQPGKSNTGHESEFAGLDEAQKDDLIEYLKTL
jgi:mono/diheme cytochrome c family protein